MIPGSGLIKHPSSFARMAWLLVDPLGMVVSGSLTSKLIAVAVLQLTGSQRMSRTPPSVDAKASKTTKSSDLLDLLASGEPPAFANDQNHRIIFWNKGAERTDGAHRRAGPWAVVPRGFLRPRSLREPFLQRNVHGGLRPIARHEAVNRFEIVDRRSHATPEVDRDDRGGDSRLQDRDTSMPCTSWTRSTMTAAASPGNSLACASSTAPSASRISLPAKDGSVPITLHVPSARATSAPQAPRTRPQRHRAALRARTGRLRAIAAGLANKDIANSLHISVATTRNHVQHILKKLNVHSKLEAVALAFRNGWA
jgi:hypothetical protein